MRVLVFESNLFWSSRVLKTLKELGFEASLVAAKDKGPFEGDAALVNLGAPEYGIEALIPSLKSQGIYVIGHAGHKEKELRELGKHAGCDRIASNSEVTFKLKELIEESRAQGT